MVSVGLAALLLFLGRADAPPAPVVLPVRMIKVDGAPSGLLARDDGLFVSSFGAASLSEFDARTRRLTRQTYLDARETAEPVVEDGREVGKKRTLFRCPPGDMVAADGKLFVGQLFSEYVVVFDAPTMWVVKRLPLGGSGIFAVSADRKTVYYASNERNEFYVIDAETYEYRTVPYPAGGHGIGAVALSPDGGRLYLGVQRGGKTPDRKEHPGGNSFLAVYDLRHRRYAGTVYLAEVNDAGASDDGIPASILPSPDGRLLYVGMVQSAAGIRVIDAAKLKRLYDISFEPDSRRTDSRWADPAALAFFKGRLLSVNRNNGEMAVVGPCSRRVLVRLTVADSGSRLTGVLVHGKRIYLTDETARRIYVLSGRKLAKLLADADGETPLVATLRPPPTTDDP